MLRPTRVTSLLTFLLLRVCLIPLAFLALPSATTAQTPSADWWLERTIELSEAGVAQPAALAYSPAAHSFLVLNAAGTQIVSLSPFIRSLGALTFDKMHVQPQNLLYDAHAQRLLVIPPDYRPLSTSGVAQLHSAVKRIDPVDVLALGVQKPTGMTIDPDTGEVWVLDAAPPRLLVLHPNLTLIRAVDLTPLGSIRLRGLAFNPTNRHLYVFNPKNATLLELTDSGQVVAVRDLTALHLQQPQALLFAPSGDVTDDPAVLNLFIADSGKGDRQGGLFELSLTPPPAVPPPDSIASLVNLIHASLWLPPSPDPAGIVHEVCSGQLLVSDSEVEEAPQPYWQAANLFMTTLPGSLTRTFTSFTSNPTSLLWNNYSNEPTGLALNPANNHLFVSDDSKDKVFEVDPGADGVLGTADDTVSAFSTAAFGSSDPEDVAYGDGKLFIADGINKEVYVVDPGSSGSFDGIPPSGDDVVTQFDVAVYGLRDAEGLGFSPDADDLLVVDRKGPLLVVTQSGNLVHSIDISSLNPVAPADVTMAPSSVNPAVNDLYLVDRNIDNGDDRMKMTACSTKFR